MADASGSALFTSAPLSQPTRLADGDDVTSRTVPGGFGTQLFTSDGAPVGGVCRRPGGRGLCGRLRRASARRRPEPDLCRRVRSRWRADRARPDRRPRQPGLAHPDLDAGRPLHRELGRRRGDLPQAGRSPADAGRDVLIVGRRHGRARLHLRDRLCRAQRRRLRRDVAERAQGRGEPGDGPQAQAVRCERQGDHGRAQPRPGPRSLAHHLRAPGAHPRRSPWRTTAPASSSCRAAMSWPSCSIR